ncbi:hypothetical protein GCM10025298_06430 [Natronobiforma cellulositropha]
MERVSFDRRRREASANENDEMGQRRTRAQPQTQRGARPHQYLSSVLRPSPEQAAQLDELIQTRGFEQVQRWGERGELPEGINTPTGEQVRVARARSRAAGVELDTPSAMRSVEAQAESDLAGETATPDVVRRVISRPGKPLEGSVREEMEERMGDSFSDVQLHTGPEAAKAASALEARAFTTGNHMVFNRGEYDPENVEGKYLLAHVRQQTGGQISMLPQKGSSLVIDPDPELEREADEVARNALERGDKPIITHSAGIGIHVQRAPPQSRFGRDGTWERDPSELPEVGTALEIVERIVATIEARDLLSGRSATPDGVRKTLAKLLESGEVGVAQLEQFEADLETLLKGGVKGVGHVINDDIANSSRNNVVGALYEFHVASGYVQGQAEVDAIGETKRTVRYDELSAAQIDEIVDEFAAAAVPEEIAAADGSSLEALSDDVVDEYIRKAAFLRGINSRADLRLRIERALNPARDGANSLTSEFDVMTTDGSYIEAKSGRVRGGDILDKAIRFKAHQLSGDVSAEGTMTVVSPQEQTFIQKDRKPRSVTQLIDAVGFLSWDVFGGEQ